MGELEHSPTGRGQSQAHSSLPHSESSTQTKVETRTSVKQKRDWQHSASDVKHTSLECEDCPCSGYDDTGSLVLCLLRSIGCTVRLVGDIKLVLNRLNDF